MSFLYVFQFTDSIFLKLIMVIPLKIKFGQHVWKTLGYGQKIGGETIIRSRTHVGE